MMISSKHLLSFTRLGAALLMFSFLFGAPLSAFAATSKIEVAGWIPYWRTEAGTKDARAHIAQFTEVNPFGYTVKLDGALADTAKMSQDAWQDLIEDARNENVRVIPTVMWSGTDSIHTTLSNPTSRAAHIDSIVDAVEKNDFDGIDIDYEGKKAETKDAYATFLKELSAELKKGKSPKWLQCTIEARMPLTARYSGTPPPNIEYANDLPKLNQYCDRVRIMTYDQQTADIQLNREHKKELYAPVADTEWVKKVVNYMAEDIDKDKMMIGIATYGYIWQAMPKPDGSGYTYIKTEAFNPRYGTEIAAEYNIAPIRGPSGELSFSYVPKETHSALPSQGDLSKLAPRGTASALLAALGAIAYAKDESRQAPVTYLTWSDAGAIEQKIKLAQDLGVKGVAIFKIDGGVDPNMWNVLPDEAPKLIAASKGTVTNDFEIPSVSIIDNPPVDTSYNFSTNLMYGHTNADVRRLQTILIAQGHLKIGTPTNFFGPMTLAAVRTWQGTNGIQATGNFGPLSRAKMMSMTR